MPCLSHRFTSLHIVPVVYYASISGISRRGRGPVERGLNPGRSDPQMGSFKITVPPDRLILKTPPV
jgi:hypothetical protein